MWLVNARGDVALPNVSRVPEHCGIDILSAGRCISARLAATSPHFMVGAQKKTAARNRHEINACQADVTSTVALLGYEPVFGPAGLFHSARKRAAISARWNRRVLQRGPR